ncbi:unnamed protein product [Didymodactylos carnosus]|uniref:Uncharacterized protein n=1 Tax=Didymodactylos carnosus TaxID=1234261 RepID=A0A815ADJ9_9BILA|nr:unnamed protein product [Didymodactylos carnosus]CAF4023829.1 unnamed protein product [Didymodactylos carnosus]
MGFNSVCGVKCSTNITPIISNRDKNYKPFREAIENNYFIKDIRLVSGDDPDHIPFIVPIFVRSGAIIPTIELEQYVGEHDGVSSKSDPINPYRDRKQDEKCDEADTANDELRAIEISHSFTSQGRTIDFKRKHNKYSLEFEKYFFLAIFHDPSETNGKSGPLKNVQIQHRKEVTKDVESKSIPVGSERQAELVNESTTNA